MPRHGDAVWGGLVALILAIAPPSQAANIAPRYIVDAGNLTGKAAWRPDRAQAAKAEKALRLFLNGGDDRHLKWPVPKLDMPGRQQVAAHIDSYVLQFTGARQGAGDRFWDFDGAGPQVIYIGGFCQASHMDLSQHLQIVMDGGPCFFSAVYDPTVDAIIYFGVNGRA